MGSLICGKTGTVRPGAFVWNSPCVTKVFHVLKLAIYPGMDSGYVPETASSLFRSKNFLSF